MTPTPIPAHRAEFTTSCRICTDRFLKSKVHTVPPICKHFYRNQRSESLSKEHAVQSTQLSVGNNRQTFFCDLTGKLITPSDGRTFGLFNRRYARKNP